MLDEILELVGEWFSQAVKENMLSIQGAAKALIPRVELPKYFKITSAPDPKGVCLEAVLHVKGSKSYKTYLPTPSPTLLDVVKAFPSVDVENMNAMAKVALGLVSLPTRWVMECAPSKKGFLLTLDVEPGKHWEKEFEVTTLQLAELVDVLDWVKEANEIDRHGIKTS